jgi:galactokinase
VTRRKEALFEAASACLPDAATAAAERPMRWFVPGRIEVLGKHTDYAGGRSLLCAVERGFAVAAVPRSDARVRITDAARGVCTELSLDGAAAPRTGWTAYADAVVRRIAGNFPGARQGADVAFASDLPSASGLSSSSALVVSIFTAVSAVNRLEERAEYRREIRSAEDLAGYLGCVENGYAFGSLAGEAGVGTFGGSEDHTAILCSAAGELAQYSFCPVRAEGRVCFPAEWTFAVGVCGIASDKTGSAREKYNRASLAARAVLALWNETTGRSDATLAGAAIEAPDAPDRIRDVLRQRRHPDFSSETLLARFDQFFEESERLVPAASEAFARADAEALSRIVDRSQELAERLLGNQIPETMTLARSARNLGAIAASAFGGGFGGSVWALVPSRSAAGFLEAWREDYRGRFPAAAARSRFFTTGAGAGLARLGA